MKPMRRTDFLGQYPAHEKTFSLMSIAIHPRLTSRDRKCAADSACAEAVFSEARYWWSVYC